MNVMNVTASLESPPEETLRPGLHTLATLAGEQPSRLDSPPAFTQPVIELYHQFSETCRPLSDGPTPGLPAVWHQGLRNPDLSDQLLRSQPPPVSHGILHPGIR